MAPAIETVASSPEQISEIDIVGEISSSSSMVTVATDGVPISTSDVLNRVTTTVSSEHSANASFSTSSGITTDELNAAIVANPVNAVKSLPDVAVPLTE